MMPAKTPTIVGGDAAEKRHQQRVQHPHQRRAPVGHLRVVLDQPLVDVIARGLAEEAEAEGLTLRREVDQRVVQQVAEAEDEQQECDELDRQRPVSRVVQEHGHTELVSAVVRHRRHAHPHVPSRHAPELLRRRGFCPTLPAPPAAVLSKRKGGAVIGAPGSRPQRKGIA
jgi:hypothetical protein